MILLFQGLRGATFLTQITNTIQGFFNSYKMFTTSYTVILPLCHLSVYAE